ncbi:hypothetical protein F2P56_033727 [Juglans regia]|uniref:TIR domain-containing protein n=1 Tax=Juglans regia TaxID=51240 RepID=A0A833WTF9_JUGRE|nr:hypothetical protein F2P56_033727 [Juglans regia]
MSYTKKVRTTHSYISSSYSESETKEHDVFLCYRGKDTRNTFTDHLYHALADKGIRTFKDETIGIGKPISPELLLAIENSSVAVVVLSKNFAFSVWCLQELARIIECMKERKMTVLPIFYHVDPSDVRHQRGFFAQAFAKHEISFEKDLEKLWAHRGERKLVACQKGGRPASRACHCGRKELVAHRKGDVLASRACCHGNPMAVTECPLV